MPLIGEIEMDRALAALRTCVEAELPRAEWLRAVISAIDPADEASLMSLLRVGHSLSWGSQHHALRHIQSPAASATPLALALYCLLQEDPNRFETCIALLPDEAAQIVSWVLDHERKGCTSC
jgi:hypothetical protein